MTNDEVIAVNQNSANNRQLFNTNNQIAWVADVPGSSDKYLAVFNASLAPAAAPATNTLAAALSASIPVSLADIGFTGDCQVRDLWTHRELGVVTGQYAPVINSHGAGLYRVSPAK